MFSHRPGAGLGSLRLNLRKWENTGLNPAPKDSPKSGGGRLSPAQLAGKGGGWGAVAEGQAAVEEGSH